LEYMANLRRLGCQEIVLVYVIYVKHLVGLSDALREEAAPKLAKQESILKAMGFSVSVETPVGVPGPTITRLANDRKCKLIVVGSHGHSLAREVALGGVATDVVHRSDLPVLVVRLQIHEENEAECRVAEADTLSNTLYATDFSDSAEWAFQYVEKLAQSGSKKVMLVHVQDASRISPHLEHRLEEFGIIDRARLERLGERLRDLGVEEVSISIPYGKPAQEIVRLIEAECASIVVMGTHGRGFTSDVLLGSVSHNVVRHSRAPVLLIPPMK
jgi:nucleotide-binding universal stress UspA family protein